MCKKKQVLIVEDERITASAIRGALINLNYAISSIVSTSNDAVKEALAKKPDIILMDIKLRGNKDGIHAAKKIRDKLDIPIVFITALMDQKILDRAKQICPYGYVNKPVDEKELYSIIELALFRHEIEKRLKQSEEQFRLLFSSMREGVCIHEMMYDKSGKAVDYRIIEVNPSFTAILGIPSKKAIGSFASELFRTGEPPYLSLYARVAETGSPEFFEAYFPQFSKHFSISVYSLGNNRLTTLFLDITETKRIEEESKKLQEQLIHSEKMAGIGTLTNGVAHEFNNLLQVQKGFLEFALKTKRPEDAEEALLRGISTSDRAAKIIKNLQMFSKEEISHKERSSITGPIEAALALFADHMKKQNIEVLRKYLNTPELEINFSEMQEVFFNIISNARDAMLLEGGTLEIRVSQGKDYVEVSFKDTGSGIKAENLGRVFEPFYTTKGAIGGNKIPGIGLGLSVSHGIVRRHGGTIKVDSQVGVGTTFTLRLPIEESRTKIDIPKKFESQKQKNVPALHILVVDDEEEICRMLLKWMTSEGHDVEFETSGRGAIDLVKKESFDVVFLDLVMPGIPAFNVLERIKILSPHTRVVMMTGKLIDQTILHEFTERGASSFLQKPFGIEDIRQVLKG